MVNFLVPRRHEVDVDGGGDDSSPALGHFHFDLQIVVELSMVGEIGDGNLRERKKTGLMQVMRHGIPNGFEAEGRVRVIVS